MKTNSAVTFFSLIAAAVILVSGIFLSVLGTGGPAGSASPGIIEDQEKNGGENEEEQADAVRNVYPLAALGTPYGYIQRFGSSGGDAALDVYFIGGCIYAFFYAGSGDYDSREKASVNLAKLDGNGTVLKTLSLGKGTYAASKPVWNGIAVCLSEKGEKDGKTDRNTLALIDLDLNAVFSRHEPFDASVRLYFFNEKLLYITSSDAALSVKAFDESLLSSVSAAVPIPTGCTVIDAFAFRSLKILLGSVSEFCVYSYSPSDAALTRITRGAGGVKRAVPKSGGYLFIADSGAVGLYDADFNKIGERSFDGEISGVEATFFGYALTTAANGGSTAYFLCPHFDVLQKKPMSADVRVVNVGGTVCFHSVSDGFLNLYKLSDFDLIPFLTASVNIILSGNPLSVNSFLSGFVSTDSRAAYDSLSGNSYDSGGAFFTVVSNDSRVAVILNSRGVSSLGSYGGNDIFVILFGRSFFGL
ncbi:MAG: hypothetical protein LBP79_04245 [Clostridiales bacterium]|nr:hypothetical protein [Clostridiales bacterium]